MKAFIHETLIRVSLLLGSWPIRFFSWWIATGYFLFRSSRRESSIRLYRIIFPGRSRWYYLYCTWRQFHSYAATFGERIEFDRNQGLNKRLTLSTQGREEFEEVARRGSGGVILMSHLGSFEIAAGAFQELRLKLLLIMGEKEAKQVARDQREAMKARGIHIQVATEGEDFLFGGMEAIKFVREGGFISVAGDLVWTEQRSRLPVSFFGYEVGFSAGPHLLALLSNAPLFTMFTFRVEKGKHLIMMSSPREVKAISRSERSAALQASAQAYANALEAMVRQHPFQWYVFEPFFEPRSADRRKSNPGFSSSNQGEAMGRQNFLLDGKRGR
jgi:predicted LPLAT superfamily acyltransferase